MPASLAPTKRAIVLEAANDALACVRPGCFSEGEWSRPGGVVEVDAHLDRLVEIVRRTTATRIEPFQVQILEDICAKCPHQEPCGYCALRGIHRCVLYEGAEALVEAIAEALMEVDDADYFAQHPRR